MVHIRFFVHAKIFHNLVSDVGCGDGVVLASVRHLLCHRGAGGGGQEGDAGEDKGVHV